MNSIIRDYDGLVNALRERQAELGLTVEKIDELSGLPNGYTGKLLGASQVKSIGPLSLGLLLDTLAIQLMPQPNDQKAKELSHRWEKRTRPSVQSKRARTHRKDKREKVLPSVLFQILGARGGKARTVSMSPEQRRISARNAVKARWKRTTKAQRVEIARGLARKRWGRRGKA